MAGTGSSPLTRGKLVDGVDRDRAAGLIPAHAGKTALFTGRPARSWAHPHSRGENHSFREGNTRTQGTSPLTRGKLPVLRCQLARAGFIPAHARKTGPSPP